MSADLYSKLTEVIEQVPRDVLYDFCYSHYAYNIKRTLRLSFVLFTRFQNKNIKRGQLMKAAPMAEEMPCTTSYTLS